MRKRLRDNELLQLVEEKIKADTSVANYGARMLASDIRLSEGKQVAERRVRQMQRELAPEDADVRTAPKPPQRREYLSGGPRSYYHANQNEKICLKNGFKVYLYAVVDGFSGKVLLLVALPAKYSRLVFACYWGTVKKYGLPVGLRVDKGTEAVILVFSQFVHGLKATTGKSTKNTRVLLSLSPSPPVLSLLCRQRQSGPH